MPKIIRNPDGIQMKAPGTTGKQPSPVILDPQMPNMSSTGTAIMPEQLGNQPGIQELQQAKPSAPGRLIKWTPLDVDKAGNAWSYTCDDRAMRIVVNRRRERGQSLDFTQNPEWIFYRMGQLIFCSTDLNALFELAEKM